MKQKLSNHKTQVFHGNTSEVTEIHNQKETEHLSTGFYSIGSEPLWDGSSLPYHELGGPGLERLCYLVLLEQGEVPRYFGKPGQEQYGIDLLVSHGGEYTVYQCKNVKSFPPSEMKKALELFEKEWLGRPGLPRPTQFVLCCSLPLQERKQNEKWTALERQFHERTGVSVVFWDCNYLDERLKRLPDVVADLFSDRVAERFCNMDDWNKDLFRFNRDDLRNLCRLVSRGLVQIGPLIRDVVPVSEAKRIYDTLRDTPNKLFGTVFIW